MNTQTLHRGNDHEEDSRTYRSAFWTGWVFGAAGGAALTAVLLVSIAAAWSLAH